MKVIVVGAGIVGSCVAHRLAVSGADVVLVESGVPGASASATSYAWVNSNNVSNPAYHALRCIGMPAHRELAAELGNSDWLHPVGNLEIQFTEARAESLRAKVSRLRALGYPATLLQSDELGHLEPALRADLRPGQAALFPTEGYIDSTPLIALLLAGLRAAGARVVNSRAVALDRDGTGRVSGVRLADGSSVSADTTVLCVGSTSELLEGVGVRLPLRGAVGASVITGPVPVRVAGLVHLPDLSVRPDGNGRLVLRAKDIDDLVDTATMRLPDDAVAELFRRARASFALDGLDLSAEHVRTSFRPRPPDGLPVVGPVPGVGGAYLVSTHSGITLGPMLGHLVTQEVFHGSPEPLLDPFRATRVIAAADDDYEAESVSA